MKARPWSKYFCASGLDVATDRVCTPRPVYWMTLDLDAPSGLVGSPSTELRPTATAAESAINIRMFLDRMVRPPFIVVRLLPLKKERSFVLITRLDFYDRSCYCQGMNTNLSKKNGADAGEPRRSKGQVSRTTILLAAAKLATTKGLDGLSIGDLAAVVGMRNSGLYAHFKTKEELELATIVTAAAIFDREVLQPVTRAPAGIARLKSLANSFLSHLERRVFPGGCFFAAVAAELDTRPGSARD